MYKPMNNYGQAGCRKYSMLWVVIVALVVAGSVATLVGLGNAQPLDTGIEVSAYSMMGEAATSNSGAVFLAVTIADSVGALWDASKVIYNWAENVVMEDVSVKEMATYGMVSFIGTLLAGGLTVTLINCNDKDIRESTNHYDVRTLYRYIYLMVALYIVGGILGASYGVYQGGENLKAYAALWSFSFLVAAGLFKLTLGVFLTQDNWFRTLGSYQFCNTCGQYQSVLCMQSGCSGFCCQNPSCADSGVCKACQAITRAMEQPIVGLPIYQDPVHVPQPAHYDPNRRSSADRLEYYSLNYDRGPGYQNSGNAPVHRVRRHDQRSFEAPAYNPSSYSSRFYEEPVSGYNPYGFASDFDGWYEPGSTDTNPAPEGYYP